MSSGRAANSFLREPQLQALHPPMEYMDAAADKTGAVDLMSEPLSRHIPPNRKGEFLVAAASQDGPDIGLLKRKQAVAHFSLGGQTQAVTVQAERTCDGGDQPHRSTSVGIAILGGRRPRVGIRHCFERRNLA